MKVYSTFICTCILFVMLSSLGFAYTDYHQLGSPNGYAYGVSGWFRENSTESNITFLFKGIEVLPLSQYKPSESEVSSFVKRLIGSSCYIEFDREQKDSRGNYQAYVWLQKPEGEVTEDYVRKNLVNAVLVERGFARVIDYKHNQKYLKYLSNIELEAREKKLGIWQ